ncbi:MAG: amino acid adenylation domain-containing protein, partial [bacterium]|nr:amino acid adenylation domain-containing protein [bacterium]
NNPELTAEKFRGPDKEQASLFPTSSNPLYRTGDLARWLPDGNIEFLGRIDQQVKIRGYRIELGEIEGQLLKCDEIKEAVVIAAEDDAGDKYICAYVVPAIPGDSLSTSRLWEYLAGKLPEYSIPSYFMPLETIPVTLSGKVDRKALPAPEVTSGSKYMAPRDEIEERLTELWAGVLGMERDKASISDSFFQVGGHSLKALTLLSKIHKTFNVRMPLAEIFNSLTIERLAEYIKRAAENRFASIEAAVKKEYYVLSPAQNRLYILQQMELESTAYNMPQWIPLEPGIDIEKIERTFSRLIRRHESLRTSFHMIDNQPVQRIHDDVEIKIEVPGLISDFVRFFDLSAAPLLRVGLIKEAGEPRMLLVDMHHIISDGISHEVLRTDFISLYNGEELPPLRIQYKDFAEWQAGEIQKENIRRQALYWLEHFAGELPVLNLPIDYSRPPVQSFEGSSIDFRVPTEAAGALKEMVSAQGATMYMLLLAGFNVLLAKLSGREDIVVGTPVSDRRHTDLEKIIGMFVNTLAMRNFPTGEKTFREFLSEVKERTLAAFENGEYPLEELVDRVSMNRDAARNPLFDVVFALNTSESDIGEETVGETPEILETAKFDLTVTALETPKELFFSFQYCTKLFKKETIERFAAYFKKMLSQLPENIEGKISEIEIIPEDEKRRLLYDFNDLEEEYLNNKTIPGLFEAQVERTPHHIAAVGTGHRQLTYRELNETSGRLARCLCSQGVKPNHLVGLMAHRSMEMIVGILGILKAGGAYVPLNSKAPAGRNRYILEECRVRILVATRFLVEEDKKMRSWKVEKVFLEMTDEGRGEVSSPPAEHHALCAPRPADLAYVIFTSGSTGRPKGVAISHANLSPLLHWGYRHLEFSSSDRFIQNLSYYFDWSVWEIVMALTTGARLYIVPDEMLLNPLRCIDFMNKHDITVLHITPTQYRFLADVPLPQASLKFLFLGAERLPLELVQRAFESVADRCRVFNMYGPTECTIISAVLEIGRNDYRDKTCGHLSSIPIGKPAGNTGLLILDNYLKLSPVNVVGELYISGDGLAAGYLNDPEKSFGTFVENSYASRGIRGERLYKTGDLARRLPDGAVEFLGRIDHQVKIRGYRIELGEIESQLLKHLEIKETVVLARERENGEKYLCAYIVPHSPHSPHSTELQEYLSQTLPDYMIPAHFIEIGELPLNANRKIDRTALPAPEAGAGAVYIAPADEVEEVLASIWADVLAIDKESISTDADFFRLGGHSLNAVLMASAVHKHLGVELPLAEIFVTPAIKGLALYIKKTAGNTYTAIPPVEKKEYYVLSSGQQRLYFLQRMVPGSTVYNMPVIIPLEEKIETARLETVFKKLIDRHE